MHVVSRAEVTRAGSFLYRLASGPSRPVEWLYKPVRIARLHEFAYSVVILEITDIRFPVHFVIRLLLLRREFLLGTLGWRNHVREIVGIYVFKYRQKLNYRLHLFRGNGLDGRGDSLNHLRVLVF
jgi:hypothetical protein